MPNRCHYTTEKGKRYFIPVCWDGVNHCDEPNPMHFCSCPQPLSVRMKLKADDELAIELAEAEDDLAEATARHNAIEREIARRQKRGDWNPHHD